jgi:hypothetical protein
MGVSLCDMLDTMKRLVLVATIFLLSCSAWAQDPAIAPLQTLPVNPPEKQQDNSASANKDTSATSGDQITKPPSVKGSTVIGCLSGPDKEGKYTLRSMHYRTGVQVLGGDDLKTDSGSKVKLTGQWEAPTSPEKDATAQAPMRRFQATQVEVLATKCSAPAETNPIDKMKKQNPTTYNAPSDDSSR